MRKDEVRLSFSHLSLQSTPAPVELASNSRVPTLMGMVSCTKDGKRPMASDSTNRSERASNFQPRMSHFRYEVITSYNKEARMIAETTARKIGNSQGVTILKEVCDATELKDFFLHEPLPQACGLSGTIVMEQVRAVDLDAQPTALIGHLDEGALDNILSCMASFFARSLPRR